MDGLRGSELKLISQLFAANLTQSAKATVCQIFKKDLTALVALLNESERHYIRCIKPNNEKNSNALSTGKSFTTVTK